MTLRISLLDQSPVSEGGTAAEALHTSVRLAQEADGLGITRYWVAEHHGSPGFAGTAPEVLAGILLANTHRLRIGSGGVLLPRYPPTKVAEAFRLLSDLYPGRVDLGIGRAGGPSNDFPERVERLVDALGTDSPQVWLLGGGTNSATLAAEFGTAFCFAHFLNPGPGLAALGTYRDAFAGAHTQPKAAVAVRVFVDESSAKAEELAQGYLLWRSRKDLGEDGPLPAPETVSRHRWTSAETARATIRRAAILVGTPEVVRDRLVDLAADHGVHELVINTLTFDPADRLRCYQLLADAFTLHAGAAKSVTV